MPVSSGEIFTFHHNHLDWTVSTFLINDENGSGGWSNNDNPPRIADYVEGGTFTAQATGGGGAEEDEGRASTATA